MRYELYDYSEGHWRSFTEREHELLAPVIERDWGAIKRLRRGETLKACYIGDMPLSRVPGDDQLEIRMGR